MEKGLGGFDCDKINFITVVLRRTFDASRRLQVMCNGAAYAKSVHGVDHGESARRRLVLPAQSILLYKVAPTKITFALVESMAASEVPKTAEHPRSSSRGMRSFLFNR